MSPGFWDNHASASKKMQELEALKKQVSFWKTLDGEIEAIEEFEKAGEDASKEISELAKKIDEKEIETFFSGKYDRRNAIVSFSAGAGGVDAQDFAEMLMRMIVRYSDKKGFSVSVLHEHKGMEAGIKSASIMVTGVNAYGYLKSESGVHRLVRISPYDADKARHTSFALVEVVPEIDVVEVEIDPKDLKVDTYRASGAGGQHVNKTDSAVRITHLPSKLVATCQSERSQAQNKDRAMKILYSKIGLRMYELAQKERKKAKGEHISVEWGNQIRSYVLHPYKLVKDHRTKYEEKDVEAVLGGKLTGFVDSFLRLNQL